MRHIRSSPLAGRRLRGTIVVQPGVWHSDKVATPRRNAVAMNHLPNSSLIQSRTARIELARQRYFEDGLAPTGVVGDAVFESWARCLRLHGHPSQRATFEPVTASRTQLALLKNRQLQQAWIEELPRLTSILSTTSCAAMLTDATGVLIGSSCAGRAHEELMPVATRLGVDLSEDAVGTTAPGVAARTGKSVCVMAGEHFFDSVRDMHCAAAPIRDIHGRIAGVLDISSERIPFEFDAAAVVGLYAGAVENRLLVVQSTEHLVVRFQVAPELLDSAMVGLVGIGVDGRQAWENGVARSLLGARVGDGHREGCAMDARLDLPWAQLASLPATGAAPLTLPNGLRVWARAEMRAPDGRRQLVVGAGLPVAPAEPGAVATVRDAMLASESATMADPEPGDTFSQARPNTLAFVETPRLRDSGLELIQKTLQACGGNVSDAAQRLGVSRGLIYRRLRAAKQRGEAASA
jgi:sigma-54 dependent transcriptional regulator, acetoin dehydrogenase operon transcriptional activator AcoR